MSRWISWLYPPPPSVEMDLLVQAVLHNQDKVRAGGMCVVSAVDDGPCCAASHVLQVHIIRLMTSHPLDDVTSA